MNSIPGSICAPQGFRTAATYAGIRSSSKEDFVLITSERPAVAAGCFTSNRVRAWCVQHNIERLREGRAQAIACFAGNANACNGNRGKEADRQLEQMVQQALGIELPVLTASTGVIGRPIAVEKLSSAIPQLSRSLGVDDERAARAIMTTDLVPKSCAVEFAIDGRRARVGGIAKGSGMIAPNMATMLAFITTDVIVSPPVLQDMLSRVVSRTFNRITVDGDTSTNDMVLVLANGCSDASADRVPGAFEEALEQVSLSLAQMIVRDGEGATKRISVTVRNGPPGSEVIARTTAESPLVKTACFGNDPNWGRILMAAGRAGVEFCLEEVAVRIAGIEVFRAGEPVDVDSASVSAAMKSPELSLEILFIGDRPAGEDVTIWTCDLSYDYVRINADYTT